ncbi:MAG: thioredoxin family protein [Ignavibacteria bacterium]
MKTILVISISILSFQIPVFSQSMSFDEALKQAKQENKKIIIDVYTDWCGWCKRMDREAYSNSDVKKVIDESFILVKLDAEGSKKNNYNGKVYTDSELAAHFQVTGYPTTVFLSSDGKVIEFNYDNYKLKSFPGYLTAPEFSKVLNYIKDEKYKDTDLSTIL